MRYTSICPYPALLHFPSIQVKYLLPYYIITTQIILEIDNEDEYYYFKFNSLNQIFNAGFIYSFF